MKMAFIIGFMACNAALPKFSLVVESTGANPYSGLYLVQDSAQRPPSDIQLQLAVNQAMQSSPLTAGSQIVVHVTEGKVTLEGAVMNELARREATRLAETVLGVKDIRNRLNVIDTQTAGTLPPR